VKGSGGLAASQDVKEWRAVTRKSAVVRGPGVVGKLALIVTQELGDTRERLLSVRGKLRVEGLRSDKRACRNRWAAESRASPRHLKRRGLLRRGADALAHYGTRAAGHRESHDPTDQGPDRWWLLLRVNASVSADAAHAPALDDGEHADSASTHARLRRTKRKRSSGCASDPVVVRCERESHPCSCARFWA
jgi:hypothetical protein